MKTAIKLTLGALIVAAALTASAKDDSPNMSTGFEYYQHCQNAMDKFETVDEGIVQIACIGYTGGILDGMALLQAMMGKESPFQMPKDGIAIGQFNMMLTNYMKQHPERLDLPTSGIAALVLHDAYPAKGR